MSVSSLKLSDWTGGIPEDRTALDQLRRIGRTDLYTFTKFILGFGEMSPNLHGDMANFLLSSSQRKLILIPRGHFKSSLCTIAYSVWRIINNPNIRILIVSASQKNAEDFLIMIGNILIGRKSEWFNALYPEVIPTPEWLKSNKWNSQEICVPRSALYAVNTVEAIGVGGGAAGRHHDIIIKDDLINEKTSRSELEMNSVIEWHKTSDSLFDVPELGLDIVVGTRWGPADYYDYLMERDLRYELFLRQCYDIEGRYGEKGEPIFPERFSKESLEDMQRRDERSFGLQYLNDPSFSSFGSLDMKDLKYYNSEPDNFIIRTDDNQRVDLQQCNIYMMVDPARTKDKKGCKSAIVVCAVDHTGRIYILEAFKEHFDSNQLIEKMYQFKDRWNPIKCAVEGVGYQESLITMIDTVGRFNRKPFCPVEAVYPKHHANGKEGRIEGMGQYAKDGKLYIRLDMKDFITEWANFGLKHKDVDLLDAFHYGPRIWSLPMSPADRAAQMMGGFSFYNRRKKGRGYR
jgi:hypothetical protein